MTFIEAAAEVLRHAGKPLHYKEITELAIAQNLLSHVGKTPEITMSHRLTAAIKKDDKDVPLVKVKPGVFALREWEGKKGRKGAAAPAAAEAPEAGDEEAGDGEEAGVEVNALEIEAAMRGAEQVSADDDEDDADTASTTPVSGEEALRADLAASGAEFFDDEDDDDQPILGGPMNQAEPAAGGAAGAAGEGGRRRRRRRRRGRGGAQGEVAAEPRFSGSGPRPEPSTPRLDGAIQPMPIVSIEGEGSVEAREGGGPSRPVVRDRQQIMAGGQPTGIDLPLAEGDELAGRELADASAIVLSSFDRNVGPVPVRSVADALLRRGRLQGDPALATTQASASMRADNLRRSAQGQRARFRFASGGRVALTDWSLGGELPRLEQDVILAEDRYREASRRAPSR